jgi:hypothetical protein
LVHKIAGKNIAKQQAIHAKISSLRSKLLGADPSAEERLLVDEIILCWLELYRERMQVAHGQNGLLPHQKFLASQRDQAKKAFQAAMRELRITRSRQPPRVRVSRQNESGRLPNTPTTDANPHKTISHAPRNRDGISTLKSKPLTDKPVRGRPSATGAKRKPG